MGADSPCANLNPHRSGAYCLPSGSRAAIKFPGSLPSAGGLLSLTWQQAEGAISIATTRTSKKKAGLLAAGASHAIATEEEDRAARVKEISGGKGARIAFDPMGGKGIEALAVAASYGGTLIEYGPLGTDPTPFPLFHAQRKALTVRGYTLFELVSDAGTFAQRHCRSHRYMESNQQIGKIVVTV